MKRLIGILIIVLILAGCKTIEPELKQIIESDREEIASLSSQNEQLERQINNYKNQLYEMMDRISNLEYEISILKVKIRDFEEPVRSYMDKELFILKDTLSYYSRFDKYTLYNCSNEQEKKRFSEQFLNGRIEEAIIHRDCLPRPLDNIHLYYRLSKGGANDFIDFDNAPNFWLDFEYFTTDSLPDDSFVLERFPNTQDKNEIQYIKFNNTDSIAVTFDSGHRAVTVESKTFYIKPVENPQRMSWKLTPDPSQKNNIRTLLSDGEYLKNYRITFNPSEGNVLVGERVKEGNLILKAEKQHWIEKVGQRYGGIISFMGGIGSAVIILVFKNFFGIWMKSSSTDSLNE